MIQKRLTKEQFVKKANFFHHHKYDYSLVVYINAHTKVKIICTHCGNVFEQQPTCHLAGQGCPKECFIKMKRELTLAK